MIYGHLYFKTHQLKPEIKLWKSKMYQNLSKNYLIYNQMKERKSKSLLLATSKQIREAARQDGHQRTKHFETSNVTLLLLLLLLWYGDFSLQNFFQECFPSFLSYFVYVCLTPRHPLHPTKIFLLLLGPANAPSLLDFPLPHTAVNRLKYFCPAQYHMT
jgi:hypothetical protein